MPPLYRVGFPRRLRDGPAEPHLQPQQEGAIRIERNPALPPGHDGHQRHRNAVRPQRRRFPLHGINLSNTKYTWSLLVFFFSGGGCGLFAVGMDGMSIVCVPLVPRQLKEAFRGAAWG